MILPTFSFKILLMNAVTKKIIDDEVTVYHPGLSLLQ